MEKELKFIPQEISEATKEEQEFLPEEILRKSPEELADFFSDLEEKNELEGFLEKAAEHESLVAMFSYWEKWLEKDQGQLIDRIVEKKREVYGESSESLPLELEKKFNEDELSLIFNNTGAIQLTFGCSKGCPFCGFDAIPGVREHIPYSQLLNLFQEYGLVLNKPHPFLLGRKRINSFLGNKEFLYREFWEYKSCFILLSGQARYIS